VNEHLKNYRFFLGSSFERIVKSLNQEITYALPN